jgi:hypothetical protein
VVVEHAEAKEMAFVCRQRLDHELELLNQRTTWIVMSNSFLFTAFAVSLNSAAADSAGAYGPALHALVRLVPLSAIASLISFYVSATAALFAMSKLQSFINLDHDPFLRTALVGGRIQRMSGLASSLLLPIIFLITWLALIWLVE